ncbi:MAG: ABC transporter substrate-binding protein, partial [Thermoprotei archaeon]
MILASLITPSVAVSFTTKYTVKENQEWPWGNKTEPFPWLDYLKSLNTENDVTLYIITRHEMTIITKTKEVFLNSPVAKELGIKDIVAIPAGPELWESYIKNALEGGNPIDVAWGGGPTLFNYIDELGYIATIDPDQNPAYYAILYEVSKIPDIIAGAPTKKADENGKIRWIGAAISSFGFTVNHDLLKQYNVPTPKTWKDLADPIYAKYLPSTPLVGIADPTKSTSNTRMYEIMLQAYGWEEG